MSVVYRLSLLIISPVSSSDFSRDTTTAKLKDKILLTEPFIVAYLSLPCRNAGTAPLRSTAGFALLLQTFAGQLCADIYAWHLEGPLQAQGSAFIKQFSEYWSNFEWKEAASFC